VSRCAAANRSHTRKKIWLSCSCVHHAEIRKRAQPQAVLMKACAHRWLQMQRSQLVGETPVTKTFEARCRAYVRHRSKVRQPMSGSQCRCQRTSLESSVSIDASFSMHASHLGSCLTGHLGRGNAHQPINCVLLQASSHSHTDLATLDTSFMNGISRSKPGMALQLHGLDHVARVISCWKPQQPALAQHQ
jgi:hypothetical protein